MQIFVSNSSSLNTTKSTQNIDSGCGEVDGVSTSFTQVFGSITSSPNTSLTEELTQTQTSPSESEVETVLEVLAQNLSESDVPMTELASWLAAQPNPDSAFQKLGLFQQQGSLPAELNQVMSQLHQYMPMNQRISFASPTNELSQSMLMVNVPEMAQLANVRPELQQYTQLVNQNEAVANTSLAQTQALIDKISELLTSLQTTSGVAVSNLSEAKGINHTQLAPSNPAIAAQQMQASVDITDPEWGKALVEQLRAKLQFSQTEQMQRLDVRLDPPELGRLAVTVTVEGDKASIQFVAAHSQLRDALASNAERLRSDFNQNALELVDVSVSSGSEHQSSKDEHEPLYAQPQERHVASNDMATDSDQESSYRYESIV